MARRFLLFNSNFSILVVAAIVHGSLASGCKDNSRSDTGGKGYSARIGGASISQSSSGDATGQSTTMNKPNTVAGSSVSTSTTPSGGGDGNTKPDGADGDDDKVGSTSPPQIPGNTNGNNNGTTHSNTPGQNPGQNPGQSTTGSNTNNGTNTNKAYRHPCGNLEPVLKQCPAVSDELAVVDKNFKTCTQLKIKPLEVCPSGIEKCVWTPAVACAQEPGKVIRAAEYLWCRPTPFPPEMKCPTSQLNLNKRDQDVLPTAPENQRLFDLMHFAERYESGFLSPGRAASAESRIRYASNDKNAKPTSATEAAHSAAAAGAATVEKPRAWLGVSLGQKAERDDPALKGSAFADGCARVNAVMSGTPAQDAGVKSGDHICEVNNKRTKDAAELIATIKSFDVGTNVLVKIIRDQKSIELKMTLAPKPGDGEEYMRSVLLGKAAPEITPDSWVSAAPASGGAFAGKVTLIDFWEPWCRPCLSTIPRLNELQKKYADQGLQVIGLATEPVEDLQKARKDLKIDYAVGYDKDGAVKSKFLVMAIPTLLLVDRSGKLIDIHIGAGDLSKLISNLEAALK